MATRKTPPRPEPKPCEVCTGTGQIATTVRIGRKRRNVGQQEGICLTCLGSGTTPE